MQSNTVDFTRRTLLKLPLSLLTARGGALKDDYPVTFVDVAHRAGKRISIHSYGPDGARDAVRAGADSVEHATDMDDATIADMAKRGTTYVPTVDHNRYYAAHKDEFGYDDAVVKRLDDYVARNFETLKRAVKAGVKIAMGSDAVFTGFGGP